MLTLLCYQPFKILLCICSYLLISIDVFRRGTPCITLNKIKNKIIEKENYTNLQFNFYKCLQKPCNKYKRDSPEHRILAQLTMAFCLPG